jgi:uncharacterized protein (TIGR02444 family)
MSDAGEAPRSPFWTFSLSVYGSEAVERACIALQDRCGVDVNMLLFALYAGSHGRSLSRADLERLDEAAAPWRANVVRPLRSVRRWLKQQRSIAPDAVETLRRGVLAREIEAEAEQQQLMERVVSIQSGSPDLEAAADNLLRYLQLCGLALDDQVASDLSALVGEAFAAVGSATAKSVLVERAKTLELR